MKKGLVLALFCWMPHAWCEDATDAFQKKLQAIRTMQATFNQVMHTSTRDTAASSGTMALSRPGRFRWQTTQPMSQLILADGARLWVYDPDLEQVTVKKQAQGVDAGAGLFLSDDATSLSKSFEITLKKTGNQTDFDLRAKSNHADFKRVTFRFEGEILHGMELLDPLGQRTVVRFQRIQVNKALPVTLFQFTPPDGVDVVDEGDIRD